jgi:hypothetical protein
LAAWAYLMRGDLLASQNKKQEALLDGYFKAAIMFDDIKSCRREALEKTTAAMNAIGDSRSERFRKELDEEFPQPPHTPMKTDATKAR